MLGMTEAQVYAIRWTPAEVGNFLVRIEKLNGELLEQFVGFDTKDDARAFAWQRRNPGRVVVTIHPVVVGDGEEI